jgi:hypothetical protein
MDVHGFAERVIDLAERMSDVADAAAGKHRRRSSTPSHWLVLPAAGAGLFALAKSDFFSQRAKTVVDEAKTLASELPNDLMNSVRQASQSPTQSSAKASGNSSPTSRRRTTRSGTARSGGQRRRQTSSASRSSTSR